jgi:uncharacterized protein YjbI with pentapeptide repeats
MKNRLTLISKAELASIELNNRISSEYKSPVIISGKEIDCDIIFDKYVHRNSGVYISKIIFKNCAFKEKVFLGTYEYAGEINFEDNCIFNDEVTVKSYGINGNVEFSDDSEFNDTVIIFVNDRSDVSFSGIKIDGDFIIYGENISSLSIKNINIGNRLGGLFISANCNRLLLEKVFLRSIHLHQKGKISEKADFEQISVDIIIIDEFHFNTLLRIINSDIQSLEVKKVIGEDKRIEVSNNCIIDNFTLPISQLDHINLRNSIIKNLKLIEANNENSILNIEKITLQSLQFINIVNKGTITISEPSILDHAEISFIFSNLGKMNFIKCDFSNAGFQFENSKVTEIFLSETDFPKLVKTNNKVNYHQAQLVFGQLSTAFQKQGDSVRSQEYLAREVNDYYNTLNWKRKTVFTKLNLWLNKWSNNFGRNWARGFIFSFGIGFLFYYFLILTTEEFYFGFPIKIKWEYFASFLKFMNPLRYFETENLFKLREDKKLPATLNNWSYLWDFLGRIFVAYGYYQTIQAFRKFGRK